MSDTTSNLGSWARRVDGALVAEPADERELIEVLHVLADRGVKLHRDIALSRARMLDVGHVQQRSMTVRVGAGVVLRELDARLRSAGLTLGPLSPAAMALRLGEFLEGPYAGLRSICGGRLEPLCTSISAVLSDGRRLQTSHAPRSAAGPDLSALVLGGQGRLAVATAATVRCEPHCERDVRVTWSFPRAAAFVAGLQHAIAEGFWPWRVHVDPRGGAVLAEIRWASTVGSVERDRDLITRCAQQAGGHGLSELSVGDGDEPVSEREATWGAVQRALEAGRPLQLFRLTLATVIARGEVDGLRLDTPAAWHPLSARLLAVDGRGILGGAP
ncbi:MAG: FAD-binding oxidoreductase [Myxococcota bacterium]